MLSTKGSSGTCIPEAYLHSYIALSRRTNTFRSVLVFALWHGVHTGWRLPMRSASWGSES